MQMMFNHPEPHQVLKKAFEMNPYKTEEMLHDDMKQDTI